MKTQICGACTSPFQNVERSSLCGVCIARLQTLTSPNVSARLQPLAAAEVAKRKPSRPEDLVGALQDSKHVSISPRVAKSVKVKQESLHKINEQLQAATSVVSHG